MRCGRGAVPHCACVAPLPFTSHISSTVVKVTLSAPHFSCRLDESGFLVNNVQVEGSIMVAGERLRGGRRAEAAVKMGDLPPPFPGPTSDIILYHHPPPPPPPPARRRVHAVGRAALGQRDAREPVAAAPAQAGARSAQRAQAAALPSGLLAAAGGRVQCLGDVTARPSTSPPAVDGCLPTQLGALRVLPLQPALCCCRFCCCCCCRPAGAGVRAAHAAAARRARAAAAPDGRAGGCARYGEWEWEWEWECVWEWVWGCMWVSLVSTWLGWCCWVR